MSWLTCAHASSHSSHMGLQTLNPECGVQSPLGWMKGKQYLRLDGKVSSHVRQQHTAKFNEPKSSVQVPTFALDFLKPCTAPFDFW